MRPPGPRSPTRPSRCAGAPHTATSRSAVPDPLLTLEKEKPMTIKPSRPAIAAAGLRKAFGDQVVLDGLDLNVPPGTVFALLGANGAAPQPQAHAAVPVDDAD